MSDSFYRAVQEEKYLKETGEWHRRKRQDEEDQRIADRKIREASGEDYPEYD